MYLGSWQLITFGDEFNLFGRFFVIFSFLNMVPFGLGSVPRIDRRIFTPLVFKPGVALISMTRFGKILPI